MVGRPRKNPESAESTSGEKETGKMFPVLLLKNYRPVDEFMIGRNREVEGEEAVVIDYVKPEPSERAKVLRKTHIMLPMDEAKTLIGKRIAERADDIR